MTSVIKQVYENSSIELIAVFDTIFFCDKDKRLPHVKLITARKS